jgi:hypothetical protein
MSRSFFEDELPAFKTLKYSEEPMGCLLREEWWLGSFK